MQRRVTLKAQHPARRAGGGDESDEPAGADAQSGPSLSTRSATDDHSTEKETYRTKQYNFKVIKGRSFLKDRKATGAALPTLLPKGIPYALNYISFEELNKHVPLQTSHQDEVSITADDLRLLYQAKCFDQSLPLSWEREVRFMELVSANCKGSFFSLPENGLGPSSGDAIAYILAKNSRYSVLDLGGNQLRDGGAASLGTLLRLNKTLVHIGLASNDIGHTGGSAIAEALESNNTVVSLDLGARSGMNGNHIGTLGAEAVGKMLRVNQVLSKLNVCSNGLGAAGLGSVVAGLKHNNSLSYLDVSMNNLRLAGAREIATAIGYGNLTHLSLQRNALGDMGGKLVFDAISNGIRNGTDLLEYVNMAYNDCGELTAKAAKKVIVSAVSLRKLCLSGNWFGSAASFLVEGIGESKFLSTFILSDCDIRSSNGAALAAALTANTALKRLDLSKNKLKDEGAAEVARGLALNRALTSINLSCNKIGDAGGMALAKCLPQNSTLRELNIRRNAMTADTGSLLSEKLRSNTALERMDVSYNDFSYKCMVDLKVLLTRNTESNRQLVVPTLNSQIEKLEPNEKELAKTLDSIEMQKSIIKDRSEQMLHRSEEARVVAEKLRRDIAELERVLERVRADSEFAEENFRRVEDRVTNEENVMRTQKTAMEAHIQSENEHAERLHYEMEKMRRQIAQLREAEEQEQAPMTNELHVIECDRDQEQESAKYEAEKLATLQLREKELRISLFTSKQTKKKKTKNKKNLAR